MPSTREQLIQYLQHNRTATAAELSSALFLTSANIRYHLNLLLQEGAVEALPAKSKQPQRGRPGIRYRLSAQYQPDNISFLAHHLLNLWLQAGNSSLPHLQQLAEVLLPAPESKAVLSIRLNQLVQALNARSYQARWEAHSAGPAVIFSNCPFAALISDHPELCQMDCMILEKWTGMKASLVARQDPDSPSPGHCRFLLSA